MTRTVLQLLAILLSMAAPLCAQVLTPVPPTSVTSANMTGRVVTAAWEPADQPLGIVISTFRVEWGIQSGVYTDTLDVGLATTAQIATLSPGQTYYFVVSAWTADGKSARSSEVMYTLPVITDPNCGFPLGGKAILVTPTALQLTGSTGPGSRFRLDFQASSPGSPVTSLAIRSGGMDLCPDDASRGPHVGSPAGLWCTIPQTARAGTYPLSIQAINLYGCVVEQLTRYTLTIQTP